VRQSLALAYVDRDVIATAQAARGELPSLTVDVVGETRNARLLEGPAYDPTGTRMRS